MAVPPLRMAPEMTTEMVRRKAELRATMRRARCAFAKDRPAIAPPAAFLALLRPGLVVAAYVPIRGEADPGLLVSAAIAAGAVIALPHIVSRKQPMQFLAWAPGQPLLPGPMQLQQPDPSAARCTPDIVLTPLIAFDQAGRRLGQGGGYYDRAFAELPDALRIGIGWSIQEVPHVPSADWDIPLHHVITEQGWIDRMPTS